MKNEKYQFFSDYTFGDLVYFKTDKEKKEYMIVGIQFTYSGGVHYKLSHGNTECYGISLEIEKSESIEKSIGFNK